MSDVDSESDNQVDLSPRDRVRQRRSRRNRTSGGEPRPVSAPGLMRGRSVAGQPEERRPRQRTYRDSSERPSNVRNSGTVTRRQRRHTGDFPGGAMLRDINEIIGENNVRVINEDPSTERGMNGNEDHTENPSQPPNSYEDYLGGGEGAGSRETHTGDDLASSLLSRLRDMMHETSQGDNREAPSTEGVDNMDNIGAGAAYPPMQSSSQVLREPRFSEHKHVIEISWECAGATGGGTRKSKQPRPFVCNVCQKTYRKNHHLKYHQMRHQSWRPFICSTCGEGFLTFQQYKQHRKLEDDTSGTSSSDSGIE